MITWWTQVQFVQEWYLTSTAVMLHRVPQYGQEMLKSSGWEVLSLYR